MDKSRAFRSESLVNPPSSIHNNSYLARFTKRRHLFRIKHSLTTSIRIDHELIFGESFTGSKDLVYEYIKATICTDIHTLQIRHDDQLVDAFEYVVPVD